MKDESSNLLARISQLEHLVDELTSRQHIRDVIHNYSRGVDRVDAEILRSCYHPDAIDEHDILMTGGRDEFVDHGMSILANSVDYTFFNNGTSIISISGDKAAAETYCQTAKMFEDADGSRVLRLTGCRFLDRLERRDGEWRIIYRRLVLEWALNTRPADKDVGIFKIRPKDIPVHWTRDKNDPSYDILASTSA